MRFLHSLLLSQEGSRRPLSLGTESEGPLTPIERAALNKAMARVAAGERALFSQVFRALWPLTRDLCARLLSNRVEAEDTAQRALMKLFEKADSFDADGDVVSWALAIAAWESRTVRKGRRPSAALPEDLAGSQSPEDDFFRRELEAEAARLLGDLSTADRETIAEAFGPNPTGAMASAAFRKRKERALKRLQLAWRKRHGSE